MATAPPRPLEVQQIQASLKAEFTGSIEGLGKTEQDKERNFLSKALAAFFLMSQAGASKAEAVAASIDGGQDHGVDSVYIGTTGVIWLVQSKYIHSGLGEPILGDASKFQLGVLDFAAGKFERFNAALQQRKAAIEAAMNGDYKLRFALVYTGTSLDEDRRTLFSDAMQRINAIHPGRAQFMRFGLSDLHDVLMARRAEQVIEVEIELQNFGLVDAPARAFYGVMRVRDLAALYQTHDHALVRANIRRYRGSSEVNAEITRTLTEAPGDFLYFNNGITLLCQRITPVGPMDAQRSRGRFRLTGVSIINGAQTAGTVAQQPLAHYETHEAYVLVTCIQEGGAADFGDRVTEYRNSQNAVTVQDFIALDDNQEDWRRTLKAAGITYIYKQSASDPHAAEKVFTAQEAANCLACSLMGTASMQLLCALRSTPERLWDRRRNLAGDAVAQTADSLYGQLFPDELTARKLWRTTQIGRMVRTIINADLGTQSLEGAAFTRETIELVSHLVFTRKRTLIDAVTLTLTSAERMEISVAIDDIRSELAKACAGAHWVGKPAAEIFSDPGNLQTLKADVIRALNTAK
ncbi:AIPR family protein [Variovorax sp. LT1R16]|uniref:AIPR family protein n=1 Tax=Variovorax sp. LT1R16 TaxID=3443728 RepID=UPI003F48B398